MARHLSVGTAIEKNRLHSDKALIALVEVDVINAQGQSAGILRFARNSEDVVYQGHTYAAANFTIKTTQSGEEQPRLQMSAEDPTRILINELEKQDGGVHSLLTMTIVNMGNLEQPPEISETFKIKNASTRGFTVSVELGAENPLTRPFPPRKQWTNHCPLQFRSTRCKYAGTETDCDYTLDGPKGCRAKNNEANFGGFPGLRTVGT